MKKISSLLLLLLMLSTSVFSACGTTPDKAADQSEQPPQYAKNDLPDLPLTKTDGTKTNTKELTGKVMIILFQPDCDHCQREATQIRQHLPAFDDYNLYFITSAPMPEINQFANDYGLNSQDNIFFAYADVMHVLKSFGQVPTPSVYIYSSQKQLVQTFKGETPITQILPFVKSE